MRTALSTLLTMVVALLALGIVMLASSSSVKGLNELHDPLFFMKRQLVWLFIAVVGAVCVARFDYHWWRKVAIPLAAVSLTLLVLVFVPGIGYKAGGSFRWLRLGPFTFQPSELAKFAVVIALASWMTYSGRRVTRLKDGTVLPLIGLGVVLGLLLLEPDYGATFLVGAVGMLILFAGGARWSYLTVAGAAGACLFAAAVMQNEVRMKRILAFLMPEKYPVQAYHLQQSKVAFMVGQLHGVGLGDSMQKQLYLPEPHTDFIFAIIGEELGFLATGTVVLLFLGLLTCGLIISTKAPDTFGRLLGFGLTMMLCVQAAINIGVVIGCLPTKGISLPFISYGGSNLLISLASVAVLANIALHSLKPTPDPHVKPIRDSRRTV